MNEYKEVLKPIITAYWAYRKESPEDTRILEDESLKDTDEFKAAYERWEAYCRAKVPGIKMGWRPVKIEYDGRYGPEYAQGWRCLACGRDVATTELPPETCPQCGGAQE